MLRPYQAETVSRVPDERLKRGFVNPETGLVFKQYDSRKPGRIRWITQEAYAIILEKQRERELNKQSDIQWVESERKRKRELMRRRRQRKEVRDREAEYKKKPEYLAKQAEYARKRNQREEVKARRREIQRASGKKRRANPKHREWQRKYDREYKRKLNRLPEFKEKLKKRYASDPIHRLKKTVRARIRDVLKSRGLRKSRKTSQFVGCDWGTLRAHIESRFADGMSWENMGRWHIDHIKPLFLAKTEEEIFNLCHYTNLQPLWAHDNLTKSFKFNG